jgi:hypothetical protein|tara:strand:+ start:250 stop:471 length:222 start_codon:yes stop_codon:yes gene_type:complete
VLVKRVEDSTPFIGEVMDKDLLALTPELILLVKKVITMSRGGLTKAEKQELAADLLQLAYKVLKEVVDDDGQP